VRYGKPGAPAARSSLEAAFKIFGGLRKKKARGFTRKIAAQLFSYGRRLVGAYYHISGFIFDEFSPDPLGHAACHDY
jgi:hypothetical protein